MKKQFLAIKSGAIFSPAVVYLGKLLRTLKSSYTNKDSFVAHMSSNTDGMAFSKAEVLRIWDALHSITYYRDHRNVPGMSDDHKLTFSHNQYSCDSNFFEDYASDIMKYGDIIKHSGRPKGFTSPAIKANLERMRAARAAKKASAVQAIVVEVPAEETQEKIDANTLKQFSDDELFAELQRREDERKKAAEERARKKAAFFELLETAGITVEEALEFISVI